MIADFGKDQVLCAHKDALNSLPRIVRYSSKPRSRAVFSEIAYRSVQNNKECCRKS